MQSKTRYTLYQATYFSNKSLSNVYFLVHQVNYLASIGGVTPDDVVYRMLMALLTNPMAQQFNWKAGTRTTVNGPCNKMAFCDLRIARAVLGKFGIKAFFETLVGYKFT